MNSMKIGKLVEDPGFQKKVASLMNKEDWDPSMFREVVENKDSFLEFLDTDEGKESLADLARRFGYSSFAALKRDMAPWANGFLARMFLPKDILEAIRIVLNHGGKNA